MKKLYRLLLFLILAGNCADPAYAQYVRQDCATAVPGATERSTCYDYNSSKWKYWSGSTWVDVPGGGTGGGGGSGTVIGSSLTNGQIVVGAGTVNIGVGNLSGDVSTSGGTVTAIGANKVTNAMLNGIISGAHGGLGANSSAFTGVIKMTAGVASIITGNPTDCIYVNASTGSCGGSVGNTLTLPTIITGIKDSGGIQVMTFPGDGTVQVGTGTQLFTYDVTALTALRTIRVPDGNTTLVVPSTATAHTFVTGVSASTGVLLTQQPALNDLTGLGAGMGLFLGTPTASNFANTLTGVIFPTSGTILTNATGVTSFAKTGSTALVGAVTLTAGTNVTLTQSGQAITIASTGGGGSGCTTAGSATQVVTDDGAGGCVSNAAFLYASGVATLGTAGSVVGKLALTNATSGTITIAPPTGALGTPTVTVPAATTTLAGLAVAETWTGVQTFNSGTIIATDPKMNAVKDSAGAVWLAGSSTASAVNGFALTNSITGNPVLFRPSGSDTNIAMTIGGKGSGVVCFDNTANCTGIMGGTVNSGIARLDGSSSGHVDIVSPASPTSYTFTVPPTAGTIGFALTTNGSGVSDWTNIGKVNSGVGGNLTYYPSTGTTVDDAPNLSWDGTATLTVGACATNCLTQDFSAVSGAKTVAWANVAGTAMVYVSNTTGSGSAALGSNSPAVTNTAPYTWMRVVTSDGSTGYMPVWK